MNDELLEGLKKLKQLLLDGEEAEASALIAQLVDYEDENESAELYHCMGFLLNHVWRIGVPIEECVEVTQKAIELITHEDQ